jgi:hypothetical protein
MIGRPAAVTSVTGHPAASTASQIGALRQRCNGAVACATAANKACPLHRTALRTAVDRS